jgi:hypothetical protein
MENEVEGEGELRFGGTDMTVEEADLVEVRNAS